MASAGAAAAGTTGFEKTMTCPVMDRPDLFDGMLASLARNDLRGWHLFVAVEPGAQQDAFAPICARHLQAGSYTVTINPRRLGLRANLYHVVRRAFDAGARVNLYLEEDFLLAPDVTALADWFAETRKPHWLCLNLLAGSCGNPGYLSHTAHPDLFFETDSFNSYGFVMTREGWARISGAWLGADARVARRYDRAKLARNGRRYLLREGWDWAILGEVLADPDLKVVQPVAARCTHTGAVGRFCNPDYQEQAYGHLSLCDARPDRGALRVVPVRDLPDLARGHAEAIAHAGTLLSMLSRRGYPLKPPPVRWIGALVSRLRGHPLDPKNPAR